MTGVRLEYALARPLADAGAQGFANVHGWHGIMRVRVAPGLDRVSVEYERLALEREGR